MKQERLHGSGNERERAGGSRRAQEKEEAGIREQQAAKMKGHGREQKIGRQTRTTEGRV